MPMKYSIPSFTIKSDERLMIRLEVDGVVVRGMVTGEALADAAVSMEQVLLDDMRRTISARLGDPQPD